MKVCHLITSLGSGGAERNLVELVNNSKIIKYNYIFKKE